MMRTATAGRPQITTITTCPLTGSQVNGIVLLESRRRLKRSILGLVITSAVSLPLALPAATAPFDENNLLLVDFILEREILGQSVTAYTTDDTTYVSLSEAAAALEFPIEVNSAEGRAKGWFISQSRTFELDLNQRTISIEDETNSLAADDALVYEHDIFIPITTFSRWFPADLSVEMRTLSVTVSPREQLPAQLRAARRQVAGTRFVMEPPSLPNITPSYELIGPPVADITLGYSIIRETKPTPLDPETQWMHSTLLRNDLAYMSSSIYLHGNKNDSLQNARMTLSRDEPFTPSGISRIEVGDIQPSWLEGAPQYDFERGVRIAGSTKKGSDLYSADGSKTYISGDILPDWEVELLHNGVRIDYQFVGPDGRYDFHELDLFTGANVFELVFYGPAGERRTETITRYGGTSHLSPGNIGYQFSASQLGQPLHESEPNTEIPEEDLGSGRYTADLAYSLTPSLSVNTGWNSVVSNAERFNYYGLGIRKGLRYASVELEGIKDPIGGTIWNAVLSTPFSSNLLGFSTKFQHTQYADSVVATAPNSDIQLTSRTSVTATGNIYALSTRLAATHNKTAANSTTNYALDLSSKIQSTRIGNSLSLETYDDPLQPNKDDRVSGSLYFDSRLMPLFIRGAYSYQLQPEREALQYMLRADVVIATDMSMNFGIEHTPLNELTTYSTGMSWHMKHLTLSPRIEYESDGTYKGFIFATFSLSPKPERRGIFASGTSLAQSGAVASRVFNDMDNDGQYSDGDTPIANATVYAPQLFQTVETDEYGVAYLTGLQARRPTDIRLDQDSLPETNMISVHPGNSVNPRPGHWDIVDFPVNLSGEIDGTIMQRRSDNSLAPQAGIVVELRNLQDELVDFRITSRDGFFIFDFVPFGTYTLTVTEDNRDRLTHPPLTLSLSELTPTHTHQDITLGTTEISPFSIAPRGSIAPTNRAETISQPTMTTKPPAALQQPLATNNTAVLQLGAFSNADKANNAIALFKQKFENTALKGFELYAQPVDLGAKGTLYRVQARGTANSNEAQTLCQRLKRLGQSCIVIKPN